MSDATLQPLLDALKFSPDNLPLRKHVGGLLRQAGQHQQAEDLYREGLRHHPTDPGLQLGLAEAYLALGKTSAAFVVVEELLANDDNSGPAHLLHAQLLHATQQPDAAREAYAHALRLDPSLTDPTLSQELQASAPRRVPASGAGGPGPDEPKSLDQAALLGLEKPRISFADVGGMEEVKEEIRLRLFTRCTSPTYTRPMARPVVAGCYCMARPAVAKPTWPAPRPAKFRLAF